MKFKQPIPEPLKQANRERRQGFGEMSDDDIRAYVDATANDPEGIKKVLRRIIRAQRALLRHMTSTVM